ncbi:MAG TPA: hypothetical protein ENI95_01650 [Chloroflexi bacterium]|nr:hypothetical protein [Chloroflexota bacterium]
MRPWAKRFALVFLVGFLSFAVALALGSISGDILSGAPFLVALRAFGVGYMAAGMVLWIALLRDEAGKPELNPLFGLLLAVGCLVLFVNLLLPGSSVRLFLAWGGLGLTLGALVIGFLAMLIAPAYPQPPTVRWPEGGDAYPLAHGHGPSHESEEAPAGEGIPHQEELVAQQVAG